MWLNDSVVRPYDVVSLEVESDLKGYKTRKACIVISL